MHGLLDGINTEEFFTLKCKKDAHQLRRYMVSFMSLDIFQMQS